jgi:hypothetical protein
VAKFTEKKLIEEYKNQESFSREELFNFFLRSEPDLKEGTFGWRIYDLKHRDVIRQIKRGLYKISYKPRFKPDVDPKLIKLSHLISKKYDGIKFCVWNTLWLNEFSRHQLSNSFSLIEADKDILESLFYFLKDNGYKNAFLKPDESVIELYVNDHNESLILKPLITRAPLEKVVKNSFKIMVPSLEKILVDIFCDEKTFFFAQGGEMSYIFENMIKKYTINYSKLFGYAKRRGNELELKNFLSKRLSDLVNDIIE